MDDHGMTEACTECGKRPGEGDGVRLLLSAREERFFCASCARHKLAGRDWAKSSYPDFAALSFEDTEGRSRRFDVSSDLVSLGLQIQAIEQGTGSYEFEILGDPAADRLDLFRSLLGRIHRGMARRHLEVRDGSLQIGREGIVRALIDEDRDREDGLPHVVIDGRPVKWEEFGRMLMSHIGWQFKLELYDLAEEIGDDSLDRGRFLMLNTLKGKVN